LLGLREVRGMADVRRVIAKDGSAAFDIPLDTRIGYGAALEAYALDRDGEIHATQKLLHVAPIERELAVTARTRPTYGPGDTVDLEVAVDRAEAADLVVSVFDRSLLGVAPD